MKKILLLLFVVILLVFAFRTLVFDGDEHTDVLDTTAQVTKDVEGDATEELADVANSMKEEAQDVLAAAKKKYNELLVTIDDISDSSLKEDMQMRVDKVKESLDTAQEEYSSSLFADSIKSAKNALSEAKSGLADAQEEIKDDVEGIKADITEGLDSARDQRQQLRLLYAQTVQEIEELTLERSSSKEKDSYTEKISDLVDKLDSIRFELDMNEASADYYDTKLELEEESDEIHKKIDKEQDRIAQINKKIDDLHVQIEKLNSDNAYLDKEYEDIVDIVKEKEELWDEIDKLRDEREEHENDLDELREELYPIEEQLDLILGVLALKEKYAELQNDITVLENLIEEYTDDYDHTLDKDERRSIVKEINSFEDDLDDLIEEKKKLTEYIEDIEADIE